MDRATLHLQRLERIVEIGRELTSTMALAELLQKIVAAAAELTDCESAGILLERDGELHFVAASLFADRLFDIPVPIESSIAGASFLSGEPVIVPDVRLDPRYYSEVEESTGFVARSLLALPLQFGPDRIGVLEVENKRHGEFDPADVETLTNLAAQATVAIKNARLVESLQKAHQVQEQRIAEQTLDLRRLNTQLQEEIAERTRNQGALTKLLELSRTLVTTRDMDAAQAQTVQAAVGIVPAADTCTLQWLGDDGETLHTVASSEPDSESRDIPPFEVGVGLAGHALVSGQVLNVPDVLQDDRFVIFEKPLRFRSLLVTPLVVKSRALGTLTLTSQEVDAFAPTDETLIGLVADQIAATLENAQDFTARRQAEQALRRSTQRLEILREIDQSVLVAHSSETIALAAINRIRGLIPCQRSMMLICEESGRIELLAAKTSAKIGTVDVELYQEMFQSPALRSGQVLGNADLSELSQPSPLQQALIAAGVRSHILVPLFGQDELLGALSLESKQPHVFAVDHIAIAREVAASLAVAIHQSRLYERAQQEIAERVRAERALKQHSDRLALLNTIGSHVAALLEVDTLLNQAARMVQTSFGYHHVALFTLETEGKELIMRTRAGAYEDLFSDEHQLKVGQGLTGWVAQQGETLLVNNVGAEPQYFNPCPDRISTYSELSVPLRLGNRVIGVLDAQSPEPHAFDDDDVMVMETLAHQIAIALENARLYRDLQEGEAHYRAVVQDQTELICRFQPDMTLTFANDAYFRFYGQRPQTTIGQSFLPTIAEEDRDQVLQALASLRPNNPVLTHEHRVLAADGEMRWMQWTNRAIFDERGQPSGFQSVGRDVTERRQAEKALQEAHEQLEATLNALPDLLFEVDRQGRIHDFRAPRPELLHVPSHEFLGQTMAELLPEPAAGIVAAAISQAVEQGHHAGVTYPLPTPAGLGWFELSIAAKGQLGQPEGRFVVLVRDITERFEMAEQLEQQKDLLESTIEALDHPFCLINVDDYRVEMANTAARNLAAGSEVMTCYALSHHLDAPCPGGDHSCPLQAVVQTKEPVTVEHVHHSATGEPHWAEVHGYPLFDGEGNVSHMIEYALDITGRKEVEQAAREAAAAAERERLARDLHDDVTQTLFSANLVAKVLPRLWETDQVAARRSLDNLGHLIRAASAEMRSLLLELRPSTLVENDLGFLLDHLGRVMTDRTDIPVVVTVGSLCEPPLDLKIALYRIAQEAMNNISKHATASQVDLSLRCDENCAELSIVDDGQGFDLDAVPVGHLGVSIMHERAAEVGARLVIDSQPGQGTQVRVIWKGSML